MESREPPPDGKSSTAILFSDFIKVIPAFLVFLCLVAWVGSLHRMRYGVSKVLINRCVPVSTYMADLARLPIVGTR